MDDMTRRRPFLLAFLLLTGCASPDRGAGELGHWWPQALPGEKKILFTLIGTHLHIRFQRLAHTDIGRH